MQLAGLGAKVLVGATIVVAVAHTQPPTNAGASIDVGFVQPNVRWDELRSVGVSAMHRVRVRNLYERLSREASAEAPSVVVWPENGIGLPLGQIPAVSNELQLQADSAGITLLAGGDELTATGRRPAIYVFGGETPATVRKASAVPGIDTGPTGAPFQFTRPRRAPSESYFATTRSDST